MLMHLNHSQPGSSHAIKTEPYANTINSVFSKSGFVLREMIFGSVNCLKRFLIILFKLIQRGNNSIESAVDFGTIFSFFSCNKIYCNLIDILFQENLLNGNRNLPVYFSLKDSCNETCRAGSFTLQFTSVYIVQS